MRRIALTDPGPVSAAFDLAPLSSESMRERARRALIIVDRVHTDGVLPRIPIDHIVDPDARAQYRMQANRGRALGIGLDLFEHHIELALVHEIGHFLDHQTLGNRGGYASNRHSSMGHWRQVVASTSEIRQLRTLDRASGETLADFLGRAAGPADRERIETLLRYTEIWARSYVQYIASRSGDRLLKHQLAEEWAAADAIQSLAFWDDDEFLPIRSAIDDVFLQKGWNNEVTDAAQ